MSKSPLTAKIKQFDTTLPFPQYKTERAAAFDLYARTTVVIPPREYKMVPLNVAIQLPEGYWAMLVVRSSLVKRGLQMMNGVGVIDNDYCGDNDEYMAPLFNLSDTDVAIEKGDRIMQVVLLPETQAILESVTKLETADRGGFGSTGTK